MLDSTRSNRWLAYFLLTLAATLLVSVAQAQDAHPPELPAWGTVPSPNGGVGPNELEAVKVFSPTDIWAVGDFGQASYPGPDPATHHWDGTTWTFVPLPTGTPKGVLLDVDGVAPDDLWAVGYAGVGGDSFIFHWDGAAWSAVPHPQGHTRQSLNGVSARATNDVWAVGDYSDNGGVSYSFAMHWNGTSWTEVATPNPSGSYSTLNSVVALAADDVWAVGDDNARGHAVHWNGTAWQVVPIPAGSSTTEYTGISALSSTDIWAVADGVGGQITAHWDGTAWSAVPNPAPTSGFGGLQDVVAVGPNDAWAVGWFDTNAWQTFAMRWNGSSWNIVSTPSPNNTINSFMGVDGDASNNVWAVGEAQGNLTARWNGTAWSEVPGSNAGLPNNTLEDVNVLSESDGWAVGNAGGQSLTLRWDGSMWKLVPSPTDPQGIFLMGVSPVAANDVWAVGHTRASGLDSHTVALRWNGSTWSRVPTPNPGGTAVDEFHDVLALAANDVWAVGEYGGTGEEALIAHWNGSAWSNVPNGCDGPLFALTALAPNDIWAVGYESCHYDGATWSNVPVPSSIQLLRGVDAIAPNDIWAVGQNTYCGPQSCTTYAISAHWNGAQWSALPIPGVSMGDVVARSPDDVYAVGTYSLGTAVAHWDGTSWEDVPAPNPGTGGELNGVALRPAGKLWAVGDFYPTETEPTQTLVLEAPSATQGAADGNVGYGGATILWLGPTTGSTVSNSFGDYAAPGLPAGNYTFVATGPGCQPQQASVQVIAGEFVRQDFDLCGTQPTPVPTRTPTPTGGATATPPPATATATMPPAPVMLDPASMVVREPTGQISEHPAMLYNMSGGSLVWSSYEARSGCGAPEALPWLDLSPRAGTLPSGGMASLMLTFDTRGLAPGTYGGFLCISDAQGRVQPMALTLTVPEDPVEMHIFLPLIGR